MTEKHQVLLYTGLMTAALGVLAGLHDLPSLVFTAIGLVMIVVAVWPVFKNMLIDAFYLFFGHWGE
jgi:hypothetical protein